jgi:hypothetical protein
MVIARVSRTDMASEGLRASIDAQRPSSPAAGSRRDAGADAGGSQVQRFVRLRLSWFDSRTRCLPAVSFKLISNAPITNDSLKQCFNEDIVRHWLLSITLQSPFLGSVFGVVFPILD